MATFPRQWFNSVTNYVKANYLCGNNPVISLDDVKDDEGNIKFTDKTCNFSKINWNSNYSNSGQVVDFSKINFTSNNFQLDCKEAYNLNLKLEYCDGCVDVNSPNIEKIHITKASGYFQQCFRHLASCTEIIIDDCSELKTDNTSYGTFSYNLKLLKIELNGFKNNSINLNSYCWQPITDEQKRQLLVTFLKSIGKLDEETCYTITLGSDLLTKLTEEDKKIATDKGWTLA